MFLEKSTQTVNAIMNGKKWCALFTNCQASEFDNPCIFMFLFVLFPFLETYVFVIFFTQSQLRKNDYPG